jgi:hypothetical protein
MVGLDGADRQPHDRRWCVVRVFRKNAILEPICSHAGVAQRTAAAGLRPPPLAVLIEAALCSVNAFGALRGRAGEPESADKLLMRLNFPRRAGNG